MHLLPLAKSLREDDFPAQVRQTSTHSPRGVKKARSHLATPVLTFRIDAFWGFFPMESREGRGIL